MTELLHDTVLLESVDSTNSWARKNLASFSQEKPTCIIARSQTQGRGRYGQTWISPNNQNIYFTMVEKKSPSLSLFHYAEVATLAVQTTLWDWQLPSKIKWPNDVLVDEKKIAGVMVEEASREEAPWAILGIGLNVNMPHEELRDIGRPATSMSEALGTAFPLPSIQKTLTEKLLEILVWAKENPETCHHRWIKSCSWILGQHISVHIGPIAQVSGIAQKFTEEGFLLIQTPSGQVVSVASGRISE